MPDNNSIAIRIRNEFSELDHLNSIVAQFIEDHELHPKAAYILELVLEEMLTNTIKYAFDDTDSHDLDVLVELRPPHIFVRLEDDGHEFDPRTAPEPRKDQPLCNMQIGGLGIYLIRSMVEKFDYRRENNRNMLDILIPMQPQGQQQASSNINADSGEAPA